MTLNDKRKADRYIASRLQKSEIKNVTGSKLIMTHIAKDKISCNPGISGSGLLASNLSETSNRLLLDFNRLLVDIYKHSQYKGSDGSLYTELMKCPEINELRSSTP